MADPICRWRNSTVKQVCEFSQILPKNKMSKKAAHNLIDECWFRWDGSSNFFKTPYQLAKQMGLYYEDESTYYPKLSKTVSLSEAEVYIRNWAKKYYVPNPYTSSMSSSDKPKVINSFLYDYISKYGDLDWDSAKNLLFGEEIGNDDILCNLLNNFSDVQITDGVVSIKNGATRPTEPIEVEYNRNDAKAFFEHLGGKIELISPIQLPQDAIEFQPYLTAIKTKPFLLLAGISGTGKSRIVRELAFMSCPKVGKLQDDPTSPGNFCMIEVKPNWHDSSELLGYTSGIKNKYIITPFVKFLVKAMRYPEVPFFVCLDEMNLAPVEQYFAEYLSVLETRKLENDSIISGCLINRDIFNNHEAEIFKSLGLETVERIEMADELVQITAIENELKEFGLRLPQNLVVVGTVNMDDTTHQFSRKVIDRAMTIEMNELNFEKMFADEDRMQYTENHLDAAMFISETVSANHALELIPENADLLKEKTIAIMQALDEKLKNTPFRVAYRVQNELVLYYYNLCSAYPNKSFDELFTITVDSMLNMKVLPRIEGDEDMIEKPLKALEAWTAESGYITSNTKIKEMLARLNHAHYTSYWP